MLNLSALQKQFAGFGQYHVQESRRKAMILEKTLEVFRNYDPEKFSPEQIPESRPDKLMAVPLEVPTAIHVPIKRPSQITVVSTDGSQIYPDRNIEPLCYLLNVGKIVFHYGTTERPILEAEPHLYFKGQELNTMAGLEIDVVGREVVSAIRDELELSELALLAQNTKKESRPILALADGTLIRWMLKRLRNPSLEDRLLQRYFEAMNRFKEDQIPLASYISMPGNAEFVHYLAKYMAGSTDELAESEDLTDRKVFGAVLNPGERSATFKSQSLVLNDYPAEHQICYFYVHVVGEGLRSEIARVEFPRWMVDVPGMLDLVHTVLLDECAKGRGYPMILSEAHEQAVVRSQERFMFYELIEREMIKVGVSMEYSSKKASKDSPVL